MFSNMYFYVLKLLLQTVSTSQATEKEGVVECLTDIFDNFRLDIEVIAD